MGRSVFIAHGRDPFASDGLSRHDGRMHGGLRTVAGVAVVILSALAGCETVTSDRSIQWVTVNESLELGVPRGFTLSRAKSVAFVDPRNPADFAAGHIEGAILVPFAQVREGAAEALRGYDILVVYDTDHDDVVARSMSKRLIEFNRWDVYTLRGGLRAWEKAGQPVAYGLPEVARSDEDGVAVEAAPKPLYGRPRR